MTYPYSEKKQKKCVILESAEQSCSIRQILSCHSSLIWSCILPLKVLVSAAVDDIFIQSTLVISTSLISNNRLSRSENLVPVLTLRSTNRQQNIVEKGSNCSLGSTSLFRNIFNISLIKESNCIFILLKVVVRLIVFLSSANLICRSTDISESLGFRDNESRLYLSF